MGILEKIPQKIQYIQSILPLFIWIIAIIGFILAFIDAKKTYNYVGIAHVSQIPTVVRCYVDEFDLASKIIPPNDVEVKFQPDQCDGELKKTQVLAGILTKSLICGGIDNFQILVDPPQVNLRAKDPNCKSHKSSIEVTYITVKR
ncbi:MAG: hypothetical protein ACREDD_05515 [Methylocella sp.]